MDAVIRMTGALEPRGAWKAEQCTIAKALEVVGRRSTLLLLREAFYGTTRFDDFAQRVGLSEGVTAARLRELVDEGLLAREAYRESGQRTRHEYKLTTKGADLLPALLALMSWGDRWLTSEGGRVEVRHRGCGSRVEARLECAAGHEPSVDELELALTRARRTRRSAAAKAS